MISLHRAVLALMLYFGDGMYQLNLWVVDGGQVAVTTVNYWLHLLYSLQVDLWLLIYQLISCSLNLTLAQVGECPMLHFLVDIVHWFCVLFLMVDE